MGLSSGKITFQKICHLLQPSIRAASSSSLGIEAMYPRYSMMAKGVCRAISIMTMENMVL